MKDPGAESGLLLVHTLYKQAFIIYKHMIEEDPNELEMTWAFAKFPPLSLSCICRQADSSFDVSSGILDV